jgi:hypothetical protein
MLHPYSWFVYSVVFLWLRQKFLFGRDVGRKHLGDNLRWKCDISCPNASSCPMKRLQIRSNFC